MKKMRRRILSSGLIVLMALCMLTTCALAMMPETNAFPRYVGIMQINANLTISSNGRATCDSKVTLNSPVYRADATMTLCRSSNGASWTPIKSWSASGKSDVELSENYYVLSGYYYKVAVTAEVYDASSKLLETVSSESNIVCY